MSEQPLIPEQRLDMTLDDRLHVEEGWVYMTGMQALVRLPIQQRIRDLAHGLNIAGFISGYRGSPLGRYDMELWNAQEALQKYNVVFKPGVNEDLAATAAWGSQYVGTFPGARGVFHLVRQGAGHGPLHGPAAACQHGGDICVDNLIAKAS